MQALHDKFKHNGFLVLGVSVDRANTKKVVDYVRQLKITFPNLHDTTSETAQIYQIRGVPMTFIIDNKGRARGVAVGQRLWMGEVSQELVRLLLAE